ncbi:hypothetical protein [Streptococcus pyogenes SSI-1]|nr:hypothetical protein [Streptococcus pyogenes SSI-1]
MFYPSFFNSAIIDLTAIAAMPTINMSTNTPSATNTICQINIFSSLIVLIG